MGLIIQQFEPSMTALQIGSIHADVKRLGSSMGKGVLFGVWVVEDEWLALRTNFHM